MLDLLIAELIAQRAVHHTFGMRQPLGIELVLNVVVVHTAQRHQVLLELVLHHQRNQIIYLTRSAEEHLALAVLHVFLDIKRDGLCHTEIPHVLGNVQTELFGQHEKVVDGMTRGEDDGRV